MHWLLPKLLSGGHARTHLRARAPCNCQPCLSSRAASHRALSLTPLDHNKHLPSRNKKKPGPRSGQRLENNKLIAATIRSIFICAKFIRQTSQSTQTNKWRKKRQKKRTGLSEQKGATVAWKNSPVRRNWTKKKEQIQIRRTAIHKVPFSQSAQTDTQMNSHWLLHGNEWGVFYTLKNSFCTWDGVKSTRSERWFHFSEVGRNIFF